MGESSAKPGSIDEPVRPARLGSPRSLRTLSVAFFGLILLPVAASADPDPDPDPTAAVVLLRQDCGDPPLENCFESMSALTTTGSTGWVWQTKTPSASDPLLIDIGPGEFGTFKCTGASRGYVTLRGSGREQTILKDASESGVAVTNCKNLSFMDLGAHGGKYGVFWTGSLGGSASWTNVDLVGLGSTITAGWADDGCTDPVVRSVQYFHGSRIRAIGGTVLATAFFTRCAESWFFGGELMLDLAQGSTNTAAVLWIDRGFVEAFGTAIRGRIRGTASLTSGELVGAQLSNNFNTSAQAVFHSHGTNFGLNTAGASDPNLDVVAISAGDGVMVHSPGTAYFLQPGSGGSATRVRSGDAMVEAPFHWSAGTEPPAIVSKDGEDLFVETDCTSTSCSGGNQPHLMIYAPNACTSGSPWWDVARNACRQ